MAADENVLRKRMGPEETSEEENLAYGKALEFLADFVDKESGNGKEPKKIPDISEWVPQRRKSINAVDGLRINLDKLCAATNVGKAAGAAAGAGGAVASVAGAVVAAAKLTPVGPFIQAAQMVQNAGAIAVGISAIVELIGSAEYLSQIDAVLKKDQELSAPLADWLCFSKELDANIRAIFGDSLSELKWKNVCKVFYEFSKLAAYVNGFDAAMSLMKRERWSLYIGNDVKVDSLKKFFQYLSARPKFADKIYIESVRVYNSLMGMSFSVSGPSFAMGVNAPAPTGGEVAFFCGFQMLNAAFHVIALIDALHIIACGESPYSEGLRQIKLGLTQELDQIQELKRKQELKPGTTEKQST